ncbi:MAG: hypothetical protein IKD43_02795, partial [Clostridia bacterium]|nr:hypothetical protein [Clostridia bacterium]
IRAELCITYGEASKKLELVYAEEAVYVSVEGMRIKASVAKLAGFIARFVEIPETDVEANELLESVLQLDISMLVTITEADDTLSLALAGNELLKLFGIDFELGEVNLCLTKEGTITAEAQGVKISVTKGSAFSFDPTGYRDITPVLEKLPALLEAKALSLEGGFTLIVGGTQIDLVITSGVLSWRNGIYLYLDALLKINDVVIPMQICVETQDLESTTVKFAYGNIGAEIAVDEIGAIGDAFMNVYNRVSGILSKILSGENVLPEAETLTELLSALLGGSALADAAQSLDWIELLQNLTFAESTHGLIAFAYEGFTIDILDRLEGLVTLNFHYASELFALRGDFNTGIYVSETLPSMPLETDDQGVPCAITYLTAEDFADVVDYIGALTGLLAEQSINLHAEGEVASTDTETFANGIKYKVVADVHYQTGGGTVFTIDTKKRSFVVDPELYLNLSLQFVSENAEVDSIYLDFFVLDANFDGSEADGILDFFVTVSNFPEGDANRNELSLHAPADEIMTILSGALTMLGGEEIALLNDYMISKWIPDDLTTVAQLRALGGELFKLIGIDLNLSELLGSLLGTAPTQGGSTAQTAGTGNLGVESAWKNWHEWEPTYYIKSISKGENGFAIVLNGKALYEGAETSEDVHILFNKEEGERGSRITLLSLDNVWNGAFTERTSLSLTLDYGAVTKAEQITAGYSAQGIEELIFALARSATHGSDDAQPVYAFNNNFYINGTISASLLGIVNLDINVEISVTIEQGEPVINVHLEYQGYAQWLLLTTIVAINGDSTLDLTIQNGMAYMKRVQTTEFTVGLLGATEKEITPIVLYRAMPLDNFMDDILDQLSFILNFGPFIADQIANAEGDSTSGGGSGIYDLGDVLTGFSYTASENSNAWNVSIDGESFSNGILGDLAAKLTAENGLLRGINITKATINIPVTDSFSLSLSLSANLRWKNAGGTMESGSDITENVSEVIEAPDTGMVGLIEKLNAEGWGEETPYLQAKPYTVNYWLETAGGSEKFSSQTVLVSTDEQDASGYAQNAIYSSNLRHPEPGALDNAKYSHAWKDEPPVSLGEVLSSDYSIRQTINTFTVLFFSESDLDQEGEENWMENGNGYFVREMTMEYDAKISFYAMGDLLGEIYTVTGSAEILLPAVPPYPEDASLIGRWAAKISEREAVFTAQYPLDIAVYYVSEIAFTLNGNTAISYTAYDETLTSGGYTLITPYAEGYTFLGWYECVNGIWQEASTEELVDHTFEALWMENLKIEKATAKRTSSGWLIKTYTYKMSIEVSGGSLCGAFANGSGVKISCKYSYTLSSGSSLGSKTFSSIQGDTNQYSNSRSSSSIDMKIELSYSYEEIFATKVEVTGKVTVST